MTLRRTQIALDDVSLNRSAARANARAAATSAALAGRRCICFERITPRSSIKLCSVIASLIVHDVPVTEVPAVNRLGVTSISVLKVDIRHVAYAWQVQLFKSAQRNHLAVVAHSKMYGYPRSISSQSHSEAGIALAKEEDIHHPRNGMIAPTLVLCK